MSAAVRQTVGRRGRGKRLVAKGYPAHRWGSRCMKMAFIALRRWLAALAPGHWRDTVNRHPRIVNLIAIIVIFLVVVDVGRQLGLPGKLFTVQHSFASRPKPLKFLNVRNLHCPPNSSPPWSPTGMAGRM